MRGPESKLPLSLPLTGLVERGTCLSISGPSPEQTRFNCLRQASSSKLWTVCSSSKVPAYRHDSAWQPFMQRRATEWHFSCLKLIQSKCSDTNDDSFALSSSGAVFVFPPERPCSDGVTYVNIPVSPASKKQLNYMELELQEPGPGPRGTLAHLPAQGECGVRSNLWWSPYSLFLQHQWSFVGHFISSPAF